MKQFEPFSFEELRLADYKKLNKTKIASDAESGVLDGPATQSEGKENISPPLQTFSFGKAEKESQAAKSTSLSHSLLPEDETTNNKISEPPLPSETSAEGSVKLSVLSQLKDVSSSRSFFGLPSKSPTTTTTTTTTTEPVHDADSSLHGIKGKVQKNVLDVQLTQSKQQTGDPTNLNNSKCISVFDSKMGKVLSIDKLNKEVPLTDQGKTPENQNPFNTLSDMAASLPQPKDISNNKAASNPEVLRQMTGTNANPFALPSTATVDVSNIGKTSNTAAQPTPTPFKFNTNPSFLPSASESKTSTSANTMESLGERQKYMKLHHTKDNKTSGADEQLRTSPLIPLKVKKTSEAKHTLATIFPQYAFLGCRIPEPSSDEDTTPPTPIATQNIFGSSNPFQGEPEPILLNTNTPWSAFICGSQGSGKSYTLSAIIENCVYPSHDIGKLPKPLAGIVFHNSTVSMHNICEAAHLVSLGVKVKVLVSRSNFHALSAIYKSAVGAKYEKSLNIQPLVLQSQHLTAERMHRLMAFQEGETTVPLYMEVIMRILREMAITGVPFSYSIFKANLDNEGLQPAQKVMMNMRLNLLESFLDPSCIKTTSRTSSRAIDLFTTSPGTLTIVDLSDPFLDSSTTCTLFSILLDVFHAARPTSGLLVCLDEAHKFMKNTPAAETFTENLLTVIREQRHNACRIVIATQEPTISPKLLDLCSMTFVHRFTSPDWLKTLRGHLAGASDLVTAASLFEKIIELDVGESLLFAPSAVLEKKEGGEVKKLGVQCVKFKTRKRLGVDGGQSVLAVRE
ncbi:hypothetical protein E4T44_03391 [Aureobasidium sp. EXF-8845]|nr:hypothetical protein E4T44_03391 [Aureobasidium sp. EXF-8845]KAI4856498.1 hypothetical protein E4T45_02039 [Aureobasidium sp. EXF-8846]